MKENGMRRRARVVNPNVPENYILILCESKYFSIPSQPTAWSAGTLYFVMNFSSYTIWLATITWIQRGGDVDTVYFVLPNTCDPKMRISPSKTLCRLEELSGLQTLLDVKETGDRTRA